ncbi:Proteasome subunit alpha 1 [Balamuthia mandrillaris]
MFRNQYDGDITIWSPQGRLHQIEYAMEAVKQGSACVGLKSKTHAVVVTLKRSSGELASYQQKIFKIDEHVGIAIAGLTSDARVLCKFMRTECLNHKYLYSSPMQTNRLVLRVADKSQKNTQQYGRRPYGVGLLVAGYDQTGAHLYETCPSGNYFDYKAMAIGARSQSAKTYLEKKFEQFEDASLEELIKHGLNALSETLGSSEVGLTGQNTSVGIVGVDTPFHVLAGTDLQPYLDQLEGTMEVAHD